MGKTPAILPNEIEENILSRIPVKTILRFMCVCKSWYSLFLDPYFINIHRENNSDHILHVHRSICSDIVVMSSSSSKVHYRFFMDGEYDYERTIVGSCNGIVCVYGLSHFRNAGGFFHDYICLWNPAAKSIKTIAISPFYFSNRKSSNNLALASAGTLSVGFGFHNNNYEVIRVEGLYVTRAEIYSLSSDSWRTMYYCPYGCWHRSFAGSYKFPSVGVHVNAAYHWDRIVDEYDYEPSNCAGIISFDTREEVFKEIIIPSECLESDIRLFNYNESLAILALPRNYYHPPCIWVMKDYGLPEFWAKICEINIPKILMIYNILGFIRPKNEIIISRYRYGDEEYDTVFDIDKITSSITNNEAFKDALQVMDYKESLLLLNSDDLIHHT